MDAEAKKYTNAKMLCLYSFIAIKAFTICTFFPTLASGPLDQTTFPSLLKQILSL